MKQKLCEKVERMWKKVKGARPIGLTNSSAIHLRGRNSWTCTVLWEGSRSECLQEFVRNWSLMHSVNELLCIVMRNSGNKWLSMSFPNFHGHSKIINNNYIHNPNDSQWSIVFKTLQNYMLINITVTSLPGQSIYELSMTGMYILCMHSLGRRNALCAYTVQRLMLHSTSGRSNTLYTEDTTRADERRRKRSTVHQGAVTPYTLKTLPEQTRSDVSALQYIRAQ